MDYYSNKGGPWANYGTHNGHGGVDGALATRLSGALREQTRIIFLVEARHPFLGGLGKPTENQPFWGVPQKYTPIYRNERIYGCLIWS